MANSCCPQHCISFQEEQYVTRSLEKRWDISSLKLSVLAKATEPRPQGGADSTQTSRENWLLTSLEDANYSEFWDH